MKKIICAFALVAFSLPSMALEIDPTVAPEISLGGRLLATADHQRQDRAADERDGESSLNVADSSLLLGFSKYLFDDTGYGFGVLGVKLPDADTEFRDDIYFHEAHVGIGGRRHELKLGRSRLGNTLIAFPTLRDDDLLDFTHVGNASANSDVEEYRQFGGVAALTWWAGRDVELDTAVTARTTTHRDGERESAGEFNGARLGVAYDVPESIKFDRGLRYAALRLDAQRAHDLGADLPRERVLAWLAAASVNLSNQPEMAWTLDTQAIVTRGTAVASLAEPAARARADSRAVAVALRYAHRPALQTRWQAALTLGWLDYPDFDDATGFAVTPSYGYRLGSGVELLAQYRYLKHDGALAAATGVDASHRVQLGLMFALDGTFNESVGERKSILNLEHNMFDAGPAGGGH